MDPGVEAQAVMASPAAFDALVASLMAQDNDARKRAELVFERVKTQPDACVRLLLHTLRQSATVEHRSFSAIMLRKVRLWRTGVFVLLLVSLFPLLPLSLSPLPPPSPRSLTARELSRPFPSPEKTKTKSRSWRATSPTSGDSAARRCR